METTYLNTFKGKFIGILRWPQLDVLWETLRNDDNSRWYIYQVGEPAPKQSVHKTDVDQFITKIDHLIRSEHTEDYCVIVHTDDIKSPSMIKIFDPNNLGVSGFR